MHYSSRCVSTGFFLQLDHDQIEHIKTPWLLAGYQASFKSENNSTLKFLFPTVLLDTLEPLFQAPQTSFPLPKPPIPIPTPSPRPPPVPVAPLDKRVLVKVVAMEYVILSAFAAASTCSKKDAFQPICDVLAQSVPLASYQMNAWSQVVSLCTSCKV